MSRTSRSASLCSSLALAILVVACAGPEVRAQIFDYAIQDPGASGALGSAVARAGDLDGDGCEDFIVGEPNATVNGIPGSGYVYLVGGQTGIVIDSVAGNPGANFGASVDGHIDFDGDGFLDVLIGAPLDSSNIHFESGAVFVYSPHLRSMLTEWYSGGVQAYMGSCVRSLEADADGDGLDDFLVTTPGNDEVTLFVAKATSYRSSFGQIGSNFGAGLCRAGDIDGDGICDYFAGSPDYVNGFGKMTGRVTAFNARDGSEIWSVEGAADSKFGTSLAQPGDLDGDGHGDIVVGAPQQLDPASNHTGCANVLSGRTQVVLHKVFGDQANDTFGHDVRPVYGDVDNDGTSDFIVGAPQLSGSEVGYARTISGATGNTLFTFTEHTSDPHTSSAYGVAVGGGDWNGDGRTDVLVGGNDFNSGDGIVETWTTPIASWNNYDAGWPGTNGVPALYPLSNPVVAKPLTIFLDDSAGKFTSGLLVIGLAKESIKTGKGGTLLVNPLLFEALSIPVGGLLFSGSVPDDPSLYGLDLYMQALELDSGASKGISFTRGLDLFFGYD
jgi:FG-GAP repeat protein